MRHAPTLLLLVLFGIAGCLVAARCAPPAALQAPRSGRAPFETAAEVAVPYGSMSTAGGNLHLVHTDLSLDTRLGTLEVGLAWNSADALWRPSFGARFDGQRFVAAGGRAHDTTALGAGDAIEGTGFRVLDATRLVTEGGLVHAFASDTGLEALHALGHEHPRIVFDRGLVAGSLRITALRQCTAPGVCTPLVGFTHDASGRLVRVDDRAGRSAEHAFDATGRLVSLLDGVAMAESRPGLALAYDGDRVASITNPEGEAVTYGYDAAGRLREVGAGPMAQRFAYRALQAGGLETTVVSPAGGHVVYEIDPEGRLVRRLEVETGVEMQLAWEGRFVTRLVTPDGEARFTKLGDDAVQVETPEGNTTVRSFARDVVDLARPFDRPLQRVDDALGPVLVHTYDADGRLASRANGEGETETFVWGALGELLLHASPAGEEVRYDDYGEHGHPRLVTRAGVAATLVYDAVGDLVSGPATEGPAAPGLPGIVSRSFDAARRLARVDLVATSVGFPASLPQALRIERRSDGRILAIRRPHGGDLEIVYDALGRPVERRERVDAALHLDRIAYDGAGRPVAHERANGTRAEWDLDAMGRVVAARWLRDGQLAASVAFGWQAGRLATVDDSVHPGIESRHYDANGRLVQVVHPEGETTRFDYDLRSRAVGESYLEGDGSLVLALTQTFDLADRPLVLSDGGGLIEGFAYASGRRHEITHGNGLVRRATFDPATGLASLLRTTDALGQDRERTGVELSAGSLGLSMLRLVTETWGSVSATIEERHHLAVPTLPGQPGARAAAFEPSAAGPTTLYAHDALGQLTTSAGFSAFSWNAEHNRLAAVQTASGALLHAYDWDASGHAMVRDAQALAWDAAGRIAAIGDARFVWDAQGRPALQEIDGVVERFRWGGTIRTRADGAPRALERGLAEIGLEGAPSRYRHLDFRGNVKAVSDDAGDVRTLVQYDANGVHAVFGEAPRRSFAGGLVVGDLVLLGHRPYDPDAGLFLGPDPYPQLTSQHGYALGNPILLWDPSGLAPAWVTSGVSVDAFEEVGGAVGGYFGTRGGALGAAAGYFVGRALGRATGTAVNNHLSTLIDRPGPPDSFVQESGASVIFDRSGGSAGRQRRTGVPTGYGSRPTEAADPSERSTSPRSAEAGRARGCVGACPGPEHWHRPRGSEPRRPRRSKDRGGNASGFGSLSGGSGTSGGSASIGCAGPALEAPPSLAAWLPLLVPLALALSVRALRDARLRAGHRRHRARRGRP